jgi:hypothetical protein
MVKARIRELRQRMSEVASIDLSRIPHDKAAMVRSWSFTMLSGRRK